MTTITYKKATANDIDSFYPFFTKCLKELFPDYPPVAIDVFLKESYSAEILKKRIKNKIYTLYLAYHDKNYAGFFLTEAAYGGVGKARWIATDPAYQHAGIASTFLQKWEKDTINAGGHAVELWTTENNVAFYKKRGFSSMGEFPNGWFNVDYFPFYKHLK